MSSLFHLASLRGCTLVVNLKSFFSFINTTPAGTEEIIGDTTLQIPGIHIFITQEKKNHLKFVAKSVQGIPNFDASGAIL